jgi:hypothetical protein
MSEHPILAAIRRCPPGLQAEKAQSEEIDRDLGLDCQTIEHALIKRARQHSQSEDFRDWGPALHGQDYQTWVGLPVQSLMTPYAEILRMLESLAPLPRSMLTDLGAGYGRLSYITSLRFPDSRCLSFEYVTERVHEGNRVYGALLPQGFHLQQADLAAADFVLPAADIHFVYDTGSHLTLRALLLKLKRQAAQRPITVVGRGRGIRHLIDAENPWLAGVYPPVQHDTFTLYRSG